MKHIPPKDLDLHWNRVMLLVAAALTATRDVHIEHIRLFLLQGMMDLFVTETDPETVMVTEFVQLPSHKVLRIVALGGENIVQFTSEWAQLREWAKKAGCDQIEAWTSTAARQRLFAHFGFSPVYTAIRADL
jgi:hypothetical protein